MQGAILTKDRYFYKTITRLLLTIILQNVVAYSVNMADNLMLGAYSQNALSGAATVNQIQFLVQQLTLAIGDSIVVLGGQYWGKRQLTPIRQISFLALLIGGAVGIGMLLLTTFIPTVILSIFTDNTAYIEEGVRYLRLIRFTYPIFIVTSLLMATLRTVETVTLALKVSIVSLCINVCINYVLIFGKWGFPELGIYGAAVGTLVSRIIELCIVLYYVLFRDKKLRLFSERRHLPSKGLSFDYFHVMWPSVLNSMLWGIATPIQTSILGHLSDDAIAANSVSTTIFQYLKIVAAGEASASSVLIGKTVGETEGDTTRIKEYSRTLQIIYIVVGVLLGVSIFFLRIPFLSFYELTPNAMEIANGMLIILAFVMVGMAYQMPTSVGIIKGGGDVKYTMYLNLISTWLIVLPLSFIGAFVLNFSPLVIVFILNSDQIFKCVPIAIHCNRYRWIKKLTGN